MTNENEISPVLMARLEEAERTLARLEAQVAALRRPSLQASPASGLVVHDNGARGWTMDLRPA